MTESLWSANTALPRFEALRGGLKTDALIIGGGMAGLLCAYMLNKSGVDCALVEADAICGGVTKNTTAKITVQHGLTGTSLLRSFTLEQARLYMEASRDALEEYRRLCPGMDCGFETRDSFVYSVDDRRKLDTELEALSALGVEADYAASLPLPIPTAGAVRIGAQAQFDPLRFAARLARGLRIYERTPVRALSGGRAQTDGGEIRAENIIVATHFPFLNKHGSYFLKLYQHRSYAAALENGPELGGMYVDESLTGLSFRNAEGCLLLGGGGHRTGREGRCWGELERLAALYYPGRDIKYRWAAQDCMSLDGAPYIGRYSARTHGLYVATGFNKWGMTGSMTAALILRDLLCGRESPCAHVFSPSRSILRPQLATNAAEAALSLLTPTKKRCPHMGCALKWNRAERSWDCPCHGSRFTEGGELISGPATGDLTEAAPRPGARQ